MNHEIAQRPDQHTGNSTPYKSFEDDNTLFVCMPEGLKSAARKTMNPSD